MKVSYYNTAIAAHSEARATTTVQSAIDGIQLAQYGSNDAYMDNAYWRVVVDGVEYTPEEATKRYTEAPNTT